MKVPVDPDLTTALPERDQQRMYIETCASHEKEANPIARMSLYDLETQVLKKARSKGTALIR